MNKQCIFCSILCTSCCCTQCNQMSRGLKFDRLLQRLETCSNSVMNRDEINSLAQQIKQVSSFE
jgi:hypothetical protein